MATIQLQLDEQTVARAHQLAKSRHVSLDELVKQLITTCEPREAPDLILGMFADEPELLDEVNEFAMTAREQHPLRASAGG
jgi:hypothetical protein